MPESDEAHSYLDSLRMPRQWENGTTMNLVDRIKLLVEDHDDELNDVQTELQDVYGDLACAQDELDKYKVAR